MKYQETREKVLESCCAWSICNDAGYFVYYGNYFSYESK